MTEGGEHAQGFVDKGLEGLAAQGGGDVGPPPDRADQVLDVPAPLDERVRGVRVLALLRAAYTSMVVPEAP